MKSKAVQHTIKVWSFPDLLLELYRYAPGPAESLPKHCHDEYQFGLSLDFPTPIILDKNLAQLPGKYLLQK